MFQVIRWCRHVIGFTAFVFLLAMLHCEESAAQAVPREAAVYLSDNVREFLNAQWDTTHAAQPERGYCLSVRRVPATRGDTVFIVTAATRALSYVDDPYFIDFDCGPTMPVLHVHTPTTCAQRTGLYAVPRSCVFGGPDAYLCVPSGTDRETLDMATTPFALIQCDRDAFVIYYPTPRL